MPRGLVAGEGSHPSIERLFLAARESGYVRQNQLAEALELSHVAIVKWVRRGVSREGAERFERRFGVRAAWILFGDGPMRAPRPDAPAIEELRRLDQAGALGPKDWDQLLQLAQVLALERAVDG